MAALVGLLLLAASACTPGASSSTTIISPGPVTTGHTPMTMHASAWQQLALPVDAADVLGYTVAPNHPNTIFLCSGHPQLSTMDPPVPAPVTLWRTTDAGMHWNRYTPELGTGLSCEFSIAPDDPQRIVFDIHQASSQERPCANDAYYLSSDGGATWKPLPPHVPGGVTGSEVWCELLVTRSHLYLITSFTVTTQNLQISMLERSSDDGKTWARADIGLGDAPLFQPPKIGPNGTLALTVLHLVPQSSEYTPMLWTSSDAGHTWLRTSILSNGVGTFLLTPPPSDTTWPSATRPFYVLEEEQIPSDLYREKALVSGDGQQWTPLPQLPVPGVSDDRPGILQVLGELPDGRLAIWGPDPQQGVPPSESEVSPMKSFWLWLWSPVSRQWQMAATSLPVTASEGCGLCWSAQSAAGADGSTYLYTSHFEDDIEQVTPPGIFRLLIR